MMLFKRIKIRSYETGLYFRDGEFKGLLSEAAKGTGTFAAALQATWREGRVRPLSSRAERDSDLRCLRLFVTGLPQLRP